MSQGQAAYDNYVGAIRDVRREELSKYGHELPWLVDPTQIPEEATISPNVAEGDVFGRCKNVAAWMVGQFSDWSTAGQSRLGLGTIFRKRGLSVDERVAVKDTLMDSALAYMPGMQAVMEIFSVVPEVATRQAIDNRSQWAEIASRSRNFGKDLAANGTLSQLLIRTYLVTERAGRIVLDQSKFKLQGTSGITTVTPIDELMEIALDVVKDIPDPDKKPFACVAMQVDSPNPHAQTMFDACWDAFTYATREFIYPMADKPTKLASQARVDTNVRGNLRAAAGLVATKRSLAHHI